MAAVGPSCYTGLENRFVPIMAAGTKVRQGLASRPLFSEIMQQVTYLAETYAHELVGIVLKGGSRCSPTSTNSS
jgi:hypothetical protein